MKIVFVLPGYIWKPAGGFRAVYEYANLLTTRGHDVAVVHPRNLRNDVLPPSNLYQRIRMIVSSLRRLLLRPNFSWQPINKKVKMLYVPEPIDKYIPDSDAVFATAWKTSEYISEYPASKGTKFYLIMDFGHWFGDKEELEDSWKLPFKKVTISHWLYEQVESITGDNDLTNIPLGIDHNRFKRIIDIRNRPKSITMMYSIYSKYKASDDGIRAIEICKKKHPDLQVTVFGPQRRPQQIPSWMNYRHNMSEMELINVYNQSRIFVCSSVAEGFAFPPAEAMACGCAVASTDCGGNREYSIDGVTALLSKPNDPEALAKNVIMLLEDDNLRIKLAEAGHEYIQQFTWERSADLLEQFIIKNIEAQSSQGHYENNQSYFY